VFAGDAVSDLFRIRAHLTSMATTAFCSDASGLVRHHIWFALSGTVICFSTGQ
jgi:hypothetical protein